jgi:hypothetical protein
MRTNICARPLTPRAAWNHQIYAAVGMSGSTTMVVMFVVCLCCCGWTRDVTSSSYVKNGTNITLRWGYWHYLVPHIGVHHTTNFVCSQHLIAKKIAELIGFNVGIWPFHAACCFNELSRGSILCLLNASFETAISQCNNLIFYAKINYHGIRRGDTGQILAWWQRPVALSVAMDLLHQAMRTSLHWRIAWSSSWSAKVVYFLTSSMSSSFTTMAKGSCYDP